MQKNPHTSKQLVNQVALIIIYNHRYDTNIDILEKLYKNRFTDIFHLMPFYDGDKPNVISVYENSYYFQGYIAQGLRSYFNENYEYYFFIADDLILNPIINEKNYKEIFKLDTETSFIPHLDYPNNGFWYWNKSVIEYRMEVDGIEFKGLLPDYYEALKKMEYFNIKNEYVDAENIYLDERKNSGEKYKLHYPVARGYSDITIVSKYSIKKFCHFCGIFAASHLFVECALPTSLILTCKKIICERDLLLQGRALWTKDDYEILEKYQQNLKKLLNDFPQNYLYLHPIKLSKWDTEDLCKK